VSTLGVSFLSREEIRVPITAREAGAVVVPTGDVVSFAFTLGGVDPSAFTAGAWETDTTTEPDTYYATIQVGGTGSGAAVVLAKGVYTVWVKVADSPDIPVKRLEDKLEVF